MGIILDHLIVLFTRNVKLAPFILEVIDDFEKGKWVKFNPKQELVKPSCYHSVMSIEGSLTPYSRSKWQVSYEGELHREGVKIELTAYERIRLRQLHKEAVRINKHLWYKHQVQLRGLSAA